MVDSGVVGGAWKGGKRGGRGVARPSMHFYCCLGVTGHGLVIFCFLSPQIYMIYNARFSSVAQAGRGTLPNRVVMGQH